LFSFFFITATIFKQSVVSPLVIKNYISLRVGRVKNIVGEQGIVDGRMGIGG